MHPKVKEATNVKERKKENILRMKKDIDLQSGIYN